MAQQGKRLADIPATIDNPVYVNLINPQLVKGAYEFHSNMKWDGTRLWKGVHNPTCSRYGWSRSIDVTLEEMTSDRWVVLPSGPVDLAAGEF